MQKFSRCVLAAAAALLVLAVTPVAGAGGSESSADSEDVAVRVAVGDDTVTLGSDAVESSLNSGVRAHARLALGTTGSTTAGSVERTSTASSQNGTEAVGSDPMEVPGVLSLDGSEGSITVEVFRSRSTAAVGASLGAAEMYGGLAALGSGDIEAETNAVATSAGSTRSLTLSDIELLRLDALLEVLGVDPLALACDAIEDAGAALGVDTADACEELAAAEGAISGAQDALADAAADLEAIVAGFVRSDVEDDRDTLESLSCSLLDPLCVTNLTDLATEYGVDITDELLALDFDGAVAEILAAIDEILAAFDDLDIVNGGIADAAEGTCDAVLGALDDVSSEVPALGGVLDPIAAALDDACDALQGILDTLLGEPLASIGEVSVAMSITARENDPEATISGSADSLSVGETSIAATVDASAAGPVAVDLEEALGDVLADLGIGLPEPQVTLLETETDEGERDGVWFAEASVAGMEISIPSATLTVPDDPPLGILGDDALGGAGIAATVGPTPAIVLGSGALDAAAEYDPSADGDTTNKKLPVTGIGGEGGMLPVAGAVLLIAATLAPAFVRRVLRND